MDIRLDRRNVLLSGLITLVLFGCALLAFAPRSLAVTNDCPAGKICLWSGPTFGGDKSFWSESDTGCHALENIDPTSMRNNTDNRLATLPGVLGSPLGHTKEFTFLNDYTGQLCIDVG
jgi:peptidase inhibitor family I36